MEAVAAAIELVDSKLRVDDLNLAVTRGALFLKDDSVGTKQTGPTRVCHLLVCVAWCKGNKRRSIQEVEDVHKGSLGASMQAQLGESLPGSSSPTGGPEPVEGAEVQAMVHRTPVLG